MAQNITPIGVTTMNLEGYKITNYHGVVRGIIVRSPTITQNLFGGLKTIVGGNIESYIEMCEQARNHAYQEMMQHAIKLGADAVIGIHYDSSEVAQGAHEVLCYGTAVSLEKAA